MHRELEIFPFRGYLREIPRFLWWSTFDLCVIKIPDNHVLLNLEQAGIGSHALCGIWCIIREIPRKRSFDKHQKKINFPTYLIQILRLTLVNQVFSILCNNVWSLKVFEFLIYKYFCFISSEYTKIITTQFFHFDNINRFKYLKTFYKQMKLWYVQTYTFLQWL